MIADISFLKKELLNKRVEKPISGTLSGHAAGEPFDKAVEEVLKEKFKSDTTKNIYRQCDYLNKLYLDNPSSTDLISRHNLIPKKTVQYLLNRGKDATKNWGKDNLFEEKQNDTADILLIEENFTHVLDVKTRNLSKSAQAPNIISALKLAEMCKIAIENNEFDKFDIKYIGLDWLLEGNNLVCKNAHIKSLFKADPSTLYINWAAALQIQFHVEDLKEDYSGDFKSWCFDYLDHFLKGANKRINYMETQWISKYKKVLDK